METFQTQKARVRPSTSSSPPGGRSLAHRGAGLPCARWHSGERWRALGSRGGTCFPHALCSRPLLPQPRLQEHHRGHEERLTGTFLVRGGLGVPGHCRAPVTCWPCCLGVKPAPSETSHLFRDGAFHRRRCSLPEQRSGSEKAVCEDVRGPHAGFGARGPAPRTALTRGREQQRAVLAVQVLHGRDPGVPRVPVVEVVQFLPFLPVPETSGKERRSVVREMQTKATGRFPPSLPGWPLSRRARALAGRGQAACVSWAVTGLPRGPESHCWVCRDIVCPRSSHRWGDDCDNDTGTKRESTCVWENPSK